MTYKTSDPIMDAARHNDEQAALEQSDEHYSAAAIASIKEAKDALLEIFSAEIVSILLKEDAVELLAEYLSEKDEPDFDEPDFDDDCFDVGGD